MVLSVEMGNVHGSVKPEYCVVSMYVSVRLEGVVMANVSPSNGEG